MKLHSIFSMFYIFIIIVICASAGALTPCYSCCPLLTQHWKLPQSPPSPTTEIFIQVWWLMGDETES